MTKKGKAAAAASDRLAAADLDRFGHEIPDPVPVAPPVGYRAKPSLIESIRSMVRQEFSAAAQRAGFESFEEADDFEVGDDFDPSSPYEQEFEPTPVAELKRRKAEAESPPPAPPAKPDPAGGDDSEGSAPAAA